MLEMVKHSICLFCQGRLFQDFNSVIKQALIGITVAIVIIVVAVKIGLSLWLSIVIASLVSGALQPFLFKDLKYA